MSGIVAAGIGLFALKKLMGTPKAKYPHTMYNCNTGQGVEVETEEQHQQYADGGWVHEFSECPIDSTFGRDYGDFDYEDSVDDMSDVQSKYDIVFEDSDVLDNTAVFRIQSLSYDPLRGRRGYYKTKGYVIASTQNINASGRPTSFNYDGDSIRMFSTMDAAIAYMKSIGKQRPTTPKKPEGDPMPDPTKPPTGEDDDPTPPPTPAPPVAPMPPFNDGGLGGFGGTAANYGGGF